MRDRRVTGGARSRSTLVLVFGLAALPALGTGCGSPSDAGPRMPVDPAVLYGQMCARCHGADGRGDAEMMKTIPGIRDFSSPQFRAANPETMEQVIMTGKAQMPGFGGSLSRPKIQHLAGYVRRLGEAGARGGAAAPTPAAPTPAAPTPAGPTNAGGPPK
jgi:mono/diheme cytochrome c family protein